MRLRVLLIGVMHVIRGDKRDPRILSKPQELLIRSLLLRNAMILKL